MRVDVSTGVEADEAVEFAVGDREQLPLLNQLLRIRDNSRTRGSATAVRAVFPGGQFNSHPNQKFQNSASLPRVHPNYLIDNAREK
jgi:hypothetical protein